MTKDKQLKVRVNAEQLAIIRANADKAIQTVSEYVIAQCVHKEAAKRVHNAETCTQKEDNVYTSPKPAPKPKEPKPKAQAKETPWVNKFSKEYMARKKK